MIEIRTRVLLKNELGMDVVPSSTLVTQKAAVSPDVAKLVDDLIAELAPSLGNLRPMTAEEADGYCAKEEAEASDGYTVVDADDDDLEEVDQ